MIILDVRDSIIKKLKALYPTYEVYDETIRQGFLEPCFFVKLIEQTTTREVSNRYKLNFMWDIHYFLSEDTVNLNEQYHTVAENLCYNLELFDHTTSGKLRGYNLRHTIQDGVLHFFLDITVYASKPVSGTLMQDLESDVNLKE